MEVKFFDYPKLFDEHKKDYLNISSKVLKSGKYIMQDDLAKFESNMRKFVKCTDFVGVADGTNAIFLSLIALGVGPGDEVILPSHTYIATASSVYFTGAKIVLVECGEDSLIDVYDCKKKITSRTKVIIPVNLNGRVCDIKNIKKIIKKSGKKIHIVEDSAQAVGAKYNSKFGGTHGDLGTYSFYPAKILGAFGDAGGIVCNSRKLSKEIRALRDHGRNKDGEIIRWGTNCRLDNFHAAFLDFKLKHLKNYIRYRRKLARVYYDNLHTLDSVKLPPVKENGQNYDAFQNFEARFKNRDNLVRYLKSKNISTIIQWAGKAVHHHKSLNLKFHLPFTDKFFKECLLLPMNTLVTKKQVLYVCNQIRSFYNK